MTIQVTMSKEEFLEWNSFQDYKQQIKCGIIDLNNAYNDLLKELLEEEKWQDRNKIDKLVKRMNEAISNIEGGKNNDNSKS